MHLSPKRHFPDCEKLKQAAEELELLPIVLLPPPPVPCLLPCLWSTVCSAKRALLFLLLDDEPGGRLSLRMLFSGCAGGAEITRILDSSLSSFDDSSPGKPACQRNPPRSGSACTRAVTCACVRSCMRTDEILSIN